MAAEPLAAEDDKLTTREHSMLASVVMFCAEHGYSPTVGELAEAEELSRGMAHRTLVDLRAKGRVTWVDGQNRTIRKAKA